MTLLTPLTPVTLHGGDLVVRTLTELGATTVFGIPGQHALGLFDALGRSSLRYVGNRVENNAAFAADGFARAGGLPAVLFLSTGPGALTALAGLQEARATGVPVLVVCSQVPRSGLEHPRSGHLHQLDEQLAAAGQVTKSARRVMRAQDIPSMVAAAWTQALTAPAGPVWVEIPQDVLLEPVTEVVASVQAGATGLPPDLLLLEQACSWLRQAERPVILAGGGLARSAVRGDLPALAEMLRAPVVTTASGKGVLRADHPLAAGSWLEDRLTTELLETADVLLVLGSALGEITSNYFTFRPQGRIISVNADPIVLDSTRARFGEILALPADAGETVRALVADLHPRPADGRAESVVQELRAGIQKRIAGQDLEAEQGLLRDVRAGVPDDAETFWDMTVAGYWAWSCWDPRSGGFHSAQGSGGIGWAFAAALGAAAASGRRTLAVSGDGGAMYSLAELAVARQHDLPVTWLVVDDGGYGILREYMTDTFGRAVGTELGRPDFVRLAEAFGVAAELVDPAGVEAAIARDWEAPGPRVVVLRQHLRMFAPTHI
ncbi:thiamine pyrophosphate-binding protein [Kineosporia sp. NBRC 101731]|uniref:thiamine pyrophosphate-binding protein n=1 Tax=Kineosporia sp. NBRC 101731 TaxID=3032199 RepID=UPI0024A57262|nr:thiamine pyrophosphate-binding protein [Kineosporia sp. NBRC 101731]GLY30405.1 acetolactate synthase [Kineosporia sp. NBRC 101731]